MQEIEQGIYLNRNYPGATLGAILSPYGTILIDSPPHPDDGQSWSSLLRSMGGGVNRVLVVLDSHPDRTIGLRALDTQIIAHLETANELEDRPAIFKGQNSNTGAEWERCEGLSGIRWGKPSMTFTEQAILEWGDQKLLIEHHPGPTPGASWLIAHEPGVVFIGDAVTVDQPPFLADANIDQWVDILDLLLAKPYKDYLIVSGRGGLVEYGDIREMRRFLREVEKRLDRFHDRGSTPEAVLKTVPNLLTRFNFKKEFEQQYMDRLEYGLQQYYMRKYGIVLEEDEG